jgi:AcrR family transcriptional regulator
MLRGVPARKSKRPRGRPAIPREVQRQRLIDAASEAFAESQYENTRVADIVNRAGMSSRSFYEFFDSKEDLVAEVVQQQGQGLIDGLKTVVEKTEDPLERIDHGLRLYLGLFSGSTIDLDRLAGAAGDQVRGVRRRYVREITDMLFDGLALAHERGLVSRPPDRLSIELVLTGIEGLSFRYYAAGRGAELLDLHPAFRAILARLFL